MPYVIPFPDIDPVLVSFRLLGFELAIRWYALAYIAGLLLGWQYVALLARRPALWGGRPALSAEQSDDLLTWMILGVILGGRIGYVLFYQPAYFAAHPAEILAVWQGGMSFHGGFLGVVAGIVGFSLRNGLPILGVGADRALLRPGRQLHQRRALGPSVARTLGGYLSRGGGTGLPARMAAALRAPSLATLRGGA
jgi:phosphatidylglycerol:prolipoprotein diacylglycerol transferase